MIDQRSRYTESYGRTKLPKHGTITISRLPEKILVFASCSGCGMKGAAYEDPNNPKQKKHYCIKCSKDSISKS